jgi:DME family drug/metabolite transporter
VLTTAGAYLLFGRGLSRIPVAVAATMSLAEPLTASLLGAFLLGDRLSATQWTGALLLLTGLALAAAPARPRLPRRSRNRMAGERRSRQHVV